MSILEKNRYIALLGRDERIKIFFVALQAY
jgi:hypothetical protein